MSLRQGSLRAEEVDGGILRISLRRVQSGQEGVPLVRRSVFIAILYPERVAAVVLLGVFRLTSSCPFWFSHSRLSPAPS